MYIGLSETPILCGKHGVFANMLFMLTSCLMFMYTLQGCAISTACSKSGVSCFVCKCACQNICEYRPEEMYYAALSVHRFSILQLYFYLVLVKYRLLTNDRKVWWLCYVKVSTISIKTSVARRNVRDIPSSSQGGQSTLPTRYTDGHIVWLIHMCILEDSWVCLSVCNMFIYMFILLQMLRKRGELYGWMRYGTANPCASDPRCHRLTINRSLRRPIERRWILKSSYWTPEIYLGEKQKWSEIVGFIDGIGDKGYGGGCKDGVRYVAFAGTGVVAYRNVSTYAATSCKAPKAYTIGSEMLNVYNQCDVFYTTSCEMLNVCKQCDVLCIVCKRLFIRVTYIRQICNKLQNRLP